jgi:thioredoxin 1
MELTFTDDNFKEEVLDSDIPVLVDFWASWCPPCKMMEPVIKKLAEEYAGKIKIGKLNVDQNPKIASKYKIRGVPTFLIFNSGKIVGRRTGAQSKEQLEQMLGVLS